MFKSLAILAIALSATACATGTTALDLNFAEESAKAGVISEVDSKSIYIASIDDERPAEEQDRIGDKRNGYGMVMGAVSTEKSVVDIIRETLVNTFEANGHSVVETATEAALTLDADINRFWFDYKTGLVTVEFFGDVKIDFALTEPSGNVIFDDAFEGYYTDKTGGGLSKTWTRVMASALDDLSQEISLSPDLMEAMMDANTSPAAGEEALSIVETVVEAVEDTTTEIVEDITDAAEEVVEDVTS